MLPDITVLATSKPIRAALPLNFTISIKRGRDGKRRYYVNAADGLFPGITSGETLMDAVKSFVNGLPHFGGERPSAEVTDKMVMSLYNFLSYTARQVTCEADEAEKQQAKQEKKESRRKRLLDISEKLDALAVEVDNLLDELADTPDEEDEDD